ncbi:MAG: HAD family phosphatase [Lachnospiraceae bacterium]|nr:HAD family phosphatase [Lachnospiraceae bacterium]
MTRKIIALDLDGTLTNSRKEISRRNKAALHNAQKQGHIVVLASGRPTPGVWSVAKRLGMDVNGGYMLSYNGARIQDCKTGEILYQCTMPEEIVPKLFAMAKEKGIGMMTYQKEGIISGEIVDDYMELEARINGLKIYPYEDPASHLVTPVNKCLGTAEPEWAAKLEEEFREHFGESIDVGRSEPFFLELIPKGVGKAESMKKLCEILGQGAEDVIALGDGFNDRSMIEYAGLGVAMANAQDIVKEAADYITASNDEDGVAMIIEKFVLQ